MNASFDGVLTALLLLTTLATTAAPLAAGAENSLIREEQHISVGGVDEIWRLQWDRKPHPYCTPSVDESWPTCPCNPFAFGEAGSLSLVRIRGGSEYERLKLTGYFTKDEEDTSSAEAALQKHKMQIDDIGRDDKITDEEIARRPVVKLMQFKDYDHDGHATEFMLPVINLVCGHELAIVIGVSVSNSHLHVFGSAETPDKPMKLEPREWAALAKGQTQVVAFPCGDHGMEDEIDLQFHVSKGSISVKQLHYSCTADGKRGKLLTEEELNKLRQSPE